jgi:alkylation response protein AidB-like acyl-CoA dehydrogenase
MLQMRITNEVVGLFGGYGYCQDYRAERLMRDAKITQIWEGTKSRSSPISWSSFL